MSTHDHDDNDLLRPQCGMSDEPWEIRGDLARGLPPRYFCDETLPCTRHATTPAKEIR